MINIVINWLDSGIDSTIEEILKHVKFGEIKKVKGSVINHIVKMRNESPFGDKIQYYANPKADYHLYINQHCNYGHKTHFTKDDNGIITFEVERLSGGSLAAVAQEVVVFEEIGKVLEFKR